MGWLGINLKNKGIDMQNKTEIYPAGLIDRLLKFARDIEESLKDFKGQIFLS